MVLCSFYTFVLSSPVHPYQHVVHRPLLSHLIQYSLFLRRNVVMPSSNIFPSLLAPPFFPLSVIRARWRQRWCDAGREDWVWSQQCLRTWGAVSPARREEFSSNKTGIYHHSTTEREGRGCEAEQRMKKIKKVR